MTEEARHDPVAYRFIPDVSLVARVQRAMMAMEDEAPPVQRYIRQQWEAAYGATRVALDAIRLIWPYESGAMPEPLRDWIDAILTSLEAAYLALDECSPYVLGETMVDVLRGVIRTHDELDLRDVPK